MNEDKVIQKLIEQDEQLFFIIGNMATKEDMRHVGDTLEGVAKIAQDIKDDHVFAIEWIKRLQAQVEKQDEEIRIIKLQLKMA